MDEENLTDKIAKFVRDKRLALGLNQKQFAEYIFGDESQRSWINKIEHGRPITVNTLDRILNALNADLELIEY